MPIDWLTWNQRHSLLQAVVAQHHCSHSRFCVSVSIKGNPHLQYPQLPAMHWLAAQCRRTRCFEDAWNRIKAAQCPGQNSSAGGATRHATERDLLLQAAAHCWCSHANIRDPETWVECAVTSRPDFPSASGLVVWDEQKMSVSGLKAELKFLESIFDPNHERFRIIDWKPDELSCQFNVTGEKLLIIHCNITVSPRPASQPACLPVRPPLPAH